HSPTPVTGGLAIALGTIIPGLIIAEAEPAVVGLGLAALVLTIVGVLDDLFDLRWYVRLVAQVAAAAIIVVVGGVKVAYIGPVLGLHETALNELSVPFTILATVGLINALNMIDGIDGLAGAMALCALAMLGAASIYAGNLELTNGLAVMIGAVGGFLAFNMRTPWRRRAAVFLGNSGSAYLGLVMAWCAFRLTQNPGHPVSPVLAPFLIAPPVIDCLVLMFRRLLHRKSPFAADRTHIHHLLLDAGFSVTGVVLALSVFSLLLGLAAGLARLADVPPPAFVVAYIAITVGYFFWSMKPARAAAMLRQLLRPGRAAPTVAEPSSSEA
ncbi:MAG TPA: MraY family glycosyltransferase, partial [Caulobacteraceae bacterium]|nr:MraY family glycosyltransferase [Caulobacteraceae bacterium]